MDELQLLIQVIAATIEDNAKQLRKMEAAGKKDTKMYAHKLGEISAYNDVMNVVISRTNQLDNGGKR